MPCHALLKKSLTGLFHAGTICITVTTRRHGDMTTKGSKMQYVAKIRTAQGTVYGYSKLSDAVAVENARYEYKLQHGGVVAGPDSQLVVYEEYDGGDVSTLYVTTLRQYEIDTN